MMSDVDQLPRSKPLIGFFGPNDPAVSLDIRGFLQGLHELGYAVPLPPRSLEEEDDQFRGLLSSLGQGELKPAWEIIVPRFAMGDGDDETLLSLAAELVRFEHEGRGLDVIVATSTMTVVAAKAAVSDAGSQIPIVIGLSADPVGAGLVRNLEEPGENVTGLSEQSGELHLKQLSLLQEIVDGLENVAALHDPRARHSAAELGRLRVAARQLGLGLNELAVPLADQGLDEGGLMSALTAARDGGGGAVLVVGAPVMAKHRDAIAAAAKANGLPVLWGSPEAAEHGILIGYGPRHRDIFRRAAYFAHRIVSTDGGQKANPASTPIEWFFPPELVLNEQAAHDIGLEFPYQVKKRADKVIPADGRSSSA